MIAALAALAGALAGFGLGWWIHDRMITRILLAEMDEHGKPYWPGID